MTSVVHISAFPQDKNGNHGGVRRSMQLCANAKRSGAIIIFPLSRKSVFRYVIYKPYFYSYALLYVFRIGLFKFSLKGFLAALFYGSWLADILKSYPRSDFSIEIAPGPSMLLAALLCASDRCNIAYPHNVHFLVPGHWQGYFSGRAGEFLIEHYIYTRASRVSAISDYDAAVIRSLGVNNVDVVPYEPVGRQREELLLIRDLRECSERSFMLILGSVGNVPTWSGINHLLRLIGLECSKPSSPAREYKLAGYGTEVFRDMAPSSIQVLGSVSNELLRELMVTCKGLLVMQPQTSGMLTRIVEAELAGVPVYVLGDYIQASDSALKNTTRIFSLTELP